MEADGQQDSAELQDLRICTEEQAQEIKSLQNKVAKLELALTTATINALQEDLILYAATWTASAQSDLRRWVKRLPRN